MSASGPSGPLVSKFLSGTLSVCQTVGCFAFIVLRIICYCKCSVILPHSAVGWSVVCDCGISLSYSLFDPYQEQHCVGPDRDTNCWQRLSAYMTKGATSKEIVEENVNPEFIFLYI